MRQEASSAPLQLAGALSTTHWHRWRSYLAHPHPPSPPSKPQGQPFPAPCTHNSGGQAGHPTPPTPEAGGQLVQQGIGLRAQGRHLPHPLQPAQLLQPAALHQHSESDQPILAHGAAQPSHLAAVAPAAAAAAAAAVPAAAAAFMRCIARGRAGGSSLGGHVGASLRDIWGRDGRQVRWRGTVGSQASGVATGGRPAGGQQCAAALTRPAAPLPSALRARLGQGWRHCCQHSAGHQGHRPLVSRVVGGGCGGAMHGHSRPPRIGLALPPTSCMLAPGEPPVVRSLWATRVVSPRPSPSGPASGPPPCT